MKDYESVREARVGIARKNLSFKEKRQHIQSVDTYRQGKHQDARSRTKIQPRPSGKKAYRKQKMVWTMGSTLLSMISSELYGAR